MGKFTKNQYLLSGFGFLFIWHLIMSRAWTPAGYDGYKVLFVAGGIIDFKHCDWNPKYTNCVPDFHLIDGAIPCGIATLIFVGLSIYCFRKAIKSN